MSRNLAGVFAAAHGMVAVPAAGVGHHRDGNHPAAFHIGLVHASVGANKAVVGFCNDDAAIHFHDTSRLL